MPTGFGPGLAKSSQLSGAVTTITSLLATDIVIGEDAQTKIDFETVNEIHFDADNAEIAKIDTNGLTISDAKTISLGDQGQLIIGDDAPGTDHTATGIVITMTALDGLAVGEAVYIDSNGKLDETDADAAGTMPAIGVALEANSSGSDAEVKVLLQGIFRDESYSFTPGEDLFIGTNLGEITATAPSGTGDFVQKVGVALTAKTIYFNPSLDLIEHA